ncbi:MAG: alpha/beta fold hydrolase [Rhodobacteraceae bacterium]|nr:alpha/beta fold hydrolase [Paracoccaceae bacterium]
MSGVVNFAAEIAVNTHRGNIIGTVTVPMLSRTETVVTLMHGYTGNRSEFRIPSVREGLFERAAHKLASAGIMSFRFDFRGSGDSSGLWRDTTFTGQAEDLANVLDFLRRDKRFTARSIALVGFSQGGLVALKAAAAGERVERIILWNPILDPLRTYGEIFGGQNMNHGRQLAQEGRTSTTVGSTELAAGFFGDIYATKPIDDALRFRGPLLIVAGARDCIAADGPNLAMSVKTKRCVPTKVVVIDADHGFDATRGTKGVDRAIQATIKFLLK